MQNNMSNNYYRQIKVKKLIALLIRNGFVSAGGTKHGKYKREDSSNAIIVPRHRSISPGTSKQICILLEKEFNIPSSEINKIF